MLVYHTSDVMLTAPDTVHSRRNLDFGKGFYTTRLKEQAVKYGERFLVLGKDAYLHTFEYTPCLSMRIKIFDSYDEEWLRFVCSCRKGGTEYGQFDIIEGGVANDKVYRTVDFFMAGIYTLEQALQQLVCHKPNHQICFITQNAIDVCLRLSDCRKINI